MPAQLKCHSVCKVEISLRWWALIEKLGGTFGRRWCNQDHHHAGIGLKTPDQVHYGQADQVYTARQTTLDHAFHQYPERFVNKPPTPRSFT